MVDGQRNCRWRAKRLWCDSFAPGGWRVERYSSVLIQADPPFALEDNLVISPQPPRDKRGRPHAYTS